MSVKKITYTVSTETVFIGIRRVFAFALNCSDFRQSPCVWGVGVLAFFPVNRGNLFYLF